MSTPFNSIIRRERIGRAVTISAGGIDASDIASIESRLDALEDITKVEQAVTSGRYYGPLTTLSGYGDTQAFTTESLRLYVSAFYCPQDANFNEIGINVTDGASSAFAAMRFGVYGIASNGLPSALVEDLGATIIGTSTGWKSLEIDLTLPRGLHWLAFATTGIIDVDSKNAGTSTGMTAVLGHFDTTGDTPRSAGYRTTLLTDLSDPLPDPFGGLGTHAPVPMIWLKAS